MRIVAYTLVVAASVVALTAPAHADKCSDLKQFPKPPLTFVPFDRTNPDTHAPYTATETITISGKALPALEALDALDALERQLTAFGYTLRDLQGATLSELGKCYDLLASQVTIVDKILSDKAGPLHPSSIADKIRAKLDLAETKIPNWDALYDQIKDPNRDVFLPKVPNFTAPTPTPKRTELKPLKKERSWAWDMGDKGNLWVQLLASFRIDGSKTEAKATAKGTANAALFGTWEGEVLGADAVSTVNGGAGNVASLNVSVRAVGKTVYTKSWAKKTIKEEDDKRFDTRKEVSYRFSIGPIPCKATIGFVGAAGIKYGYEVVPIALSVFVVPYVDTKAYAQVGVDFVILSGGVGGEVTLLNDTLTLQGSFAVSFEDEPSLVLELTGKNSVNCLSGRLYAYAKIDLWLFSKSYDHTLFDWTGYKKEADLFKFRTTWGPNGVTAEGDLTAEDVMEVTADNEERRLVDLENLSQQRAFEVFDAAARDFNGSAAAQVSFERDRHAGISHAIDDALELLRAELARSGGV